MMDPAAFAEARLDEDEAGIEAWIKGEIERLAADGVDVDREELLTDAPPHYKSMFRLPLCDIAAYRAILARYRDCLARMEDPAYGQAVARDQAREYEDFVLPNLLTRWDDHEDYDPEWRP
jgi:hypothetical protein